ncbi:MULTISPECIES: phosphatase PAP2 family protein [unclassified Streptomyces]|uniref:phosphatase PAP2 family protein n=1 Tax=unclassified Streptomyces TaxID=2593676 RepID=UPI000DBAA906|nr:MULTISPECIES: phosphatase PAP2 family protein [unclassified Streptomyces]MYT72348.1 phosphatase PAP2 family protein [Streptomyces sp. SID8367]RAJ81764.1 undecaprenyl-diphosphatase [Streptomyces sp. PsTaAH-137]
MAGLEALAALETSGSNPDVTLLYDINGLAADAPGWFDRTMEFVGEYGILLGLVLVVLWTWWGARKRDTLDDAASSVAAVVWAPLAAAVAVLVNVPIRGFVERPRPFKDHDGLTVLVDGKTDFSFVSDHATLAMAMGAALFVAHRRLGFAAIGLAVLEGFCRVFMGVHYPTDVVGGFALGTAVALLLSPLASALITPLARVVGRTGRLSRLVWAPGAAPAALEIPGARGASEDPEERDLAA